MSASWYEFKITVPSEIKEWVSERLFEVGAEGINENVSNPNLLQAYFPEDRKDFAARALADFWASQKSLFPNLPEMNLIITEVPKENWAETYKKYYVAQFLTDLFFLRPKWDNETKIPSGMIPIFMDPGQAFGTGLHPSTRLCIRTLQSQILNNINKKQINCLDVGTGTGILALAAYHLGVKKVVGVDNDPVAIEVAKENMELNKVSAVELSTTDISDLSAPFEFLISNILLETHRELSAEYARLVPQGGLLLLSGLLGHQKQELFELLTPLGFTPLEARNFQEWASFLFVRRD